MKKNLSHFAAIFSSNDPLKLAHWYRDKLGFEITFKWGNPVEYIITNREEIVSIHFSKTQEKVLEPKLLYVFCHDVDILYEELKKRGINRITVPEDQDYQMRDFDVTDPEGNRITFGRGNT